MSVVQEDNSETVWICDAMQREKSVPIAVTQSFIDSDTSSSDSTSKTRRLLLLKQLLSGDYYSQEDHFSVAWEKFAAKDKWTCDNSTIFWNNPQYEKFNHFKCIRKQSHSNSYMNATVLLLHYVIAINTNGENCSMVDIVKHSAQSKTGEQLLAFVNKVIKRGGNAVDYTRSLVQCTDGSLFENWYIDSYYPSKESFYTFLDQIILRLRSYPALISQFQICEDFVVSGGLDAACHSHVLPDSPYRMPPSRHAMVLVGGRYETNSDGTKSYFFLVQNTWEGKYFVEMSAEYLVHCSPLISFVKQHVVGYHPGTPTYTASYAEAADGCDG